jgi:hypothetical protein
MVAACNSVTSNKDQACPMKAMAVTICAATRGHAQPDHWQNVGEAIFRKGCTKTSSDPETSIK